MVNQSLAPLFSICVLRDLTARIFFSPNKALWYVNLFLRKELDIVAFIQWLTQLPFWTLFYRTVKLFANRDEIIRRLFQKSSYKATLLMRAVKGTSLSGGGVGGWYVSHLDRIGL